MYLSHSLQYLPLVRNRDLNITVQPLSKHSFLHSSFYILILNCFLLNCLLCYFSQHVCVCIWTYYLAVAFMLIDFTPLTFLKCRLIIVYIVYTHHLCGLRGSHRRACLGSGHSQWHRHLTPSRSCGNSLSHPAALGHGCSCWLSHTPAHPWLTASVLPGELLVLWCRGKCWLRNDPVTCPQLVNTVRVLGCRGPLRAADVPSHPGHPNVLALAMSNCRICFSHFHANTLYMCRSI